MEAINTQTGLLGSREGHEVCSKLSRQEKANTPFDLQSFEHEIFKSLSIFSSVQFISVVQSCPTLCNPMNCRTPGLPVHHQLPEFTQTHVHRVVMPSSYLILCRPLLFLPPIPPSIRVFSNESTLHMGWPKYWSFSFSITFPTKVRLVKAMVFPVVMYGRESWTVKKAER